MRRMISLAATACLAIGLSSCAELSSLKQSVFKKDKKASQTLHNTDASLLRGAPQQSFVFDGSQKYDVVIYDNPVTPAQRGNVHYYYSDHYYAMEQRLNATGYVAPASYTVEIFDSAGF